MSVKDDKTPIYRCPQCFSVLILEDNEIGLWACTEPRCGRKIIMLEEPSARWAWHDEQRIKSQLSKKGSGGHSGKRRKIKRAKPNRWYQVDRSVTERHGKQKGNQSEVAGGSDTQAQDDSGNGECESERSDSEAS